SGGVVATGPVTINAQSGNVLVNAAIATTDSSANAIVIGTGTATSGGSAVGSDTGGDVKLAVLTTIVPGVGGRAIIYSGSIANTTGFGSLLPLGGSQSRYGRSYGDTSLIGSNSGFYMQYREKPVVDVTLANNSKTYDGTALNNAAFSTTSG